MADDYVQVAPDNTGKKVQTFSNTVSGNNVETQGVALVDSTGVPITTANPLGVSANVSSGHINIDDLAVALAAILRAIQRPMYMEMGTARVKVNVETGSLSTVSTVTTLTNLAGASAKDTLLNSTDRNAWYNSVRSRIV